MALLTIDNEERLAVFGGSGYDEADYPFPGDIDTVETLNPRTRKWEISIRKVGIDP